MPGQESNLINLTFARGPAAVKVRTQNIWALRIAELLMPFASSRVGGKRFMMSAEKDPPIQNQILTALPRRERERLLPYLEPVSLERGAVLCEPGQALRHGYFPDTVLFALLSLAESGESIEVGLLGYEGVLGIPILFGIARAFRFDLRSGFLAVRTG